MYDIIVAGKSQHKSSFDEIKGDNPHAIWLPDAGSVWHAMRAARKLALTEMFWLVTDELFDVESMDVDFSWKPPVFDRGYPHVWEAREKDGKRIDLFRGLHLIPRGYEVSDSEIEGNCLDNLKIMDNFNITMGTFDIFFAGFDGVRADGDFDELSSKLPGVKSLPGVDNIWQAMDEGAKRARTSMFWLATDELFDVESMDVDFSWKPSPFDRIYPHVWPATEKNGTVIDRFKGLQLIPRGYEVSDSEIEGNCLGSVKMSDNFNIVLRTFDMFFISYDEKYANRHFNMLKRRFPGIKRIHGVDGIANAHRRCAELSETKMFWTIDADTVVDDGFDFSYKPMEYDRGYLHLWNSRNPVNGLEYGWGAVKLWPRELVMSHGGDSYLDYTTSLGFLKIMDDVIATTRFNSDPFRAWRSGFREAVKLARNVREGDAGESLHRLHAWCTISNRVPFAADAVTGANDGLWYYLDTDGPVNVINEFGWLRSVYLDRSDMIKRPWGNGELGSTDILRRLMLDGAHV
jgi:hypothetical protein